MNGQAYPSWGRYPRVEQRAQRLSWRFEALPVNAGGEQVMLPRGNGRSYGDVCLNEGGTLLDCRGLDRFISFDADKGVLRCEAGVLLSNILDLVVPRGWFLPVTPGTRFVTVGGAIANDVHGKNHHRVGTFGAQVRCLELLRSDGSRLKCSPSENTGYFQATVGGLGLTGVITWAELQLKRVPGPLVDQEVVRFGSLAEWFVLAAESDREFEYTVAWVDCLAKDAELGRGLFTRGNHSEERTTRKTPARRMSIPLELPVPLVNGLTLKWFNRLYYGKQRAGRTRSVVHHRPFFYPLDAIGHWNRIYGPKGFFQYQCVVPQTHAEEAIREMLERIARAGTGSFLAVLKGFGDRPSPGLISFPMPGITLALDFPNRGEETLKLLDQLDEVTRQAGGRVNPSKDARMSAADFQAGFPRWVELERLRDPMISSSFWRRVTR